ncbi:MAG: YdeI/OmpD-associated family protein [Ignavibacteriaceae bacterium]|nr:YdeI/OmpD-associated family protein [Ignavibacteriaceae bacterium]
MRKTNPVISFESAKEFERWLEQKHLKYEEIWLRIFKKDSGKNSVTYPEALDEALCYGWIDGQKDKYDDTSWLQKFTPRRPGSKWSERNTQNAERLIKSGKMKPSGMKEIEAAKSDGRWNTAYSPQSTAAVPEDFLMELKKNKKAETFFNTLNKTNIYSITYRLQTAKKTETRQKRIKLILEMLSNGKKFHP